MRPHPEYCQLWDPRHKNDMDLSEQVQRKATKMVRGREYLSCEKKVERVGVVQLSERKTLLQPFNI